MALAVLTVDAACKIISPEFPRRVAPYGFVPPQFDLQKLIFVQLLLE